jgi:hypothetical protein
VNLALHRRNRCLTLSIRLRREEFGQIVIIVILRSSDAFQAFPLLLCLLLLPLLLFLSIFNDFRCTALKSTGHIPVFLNACLIIKGLKVCCRIKGRSQKKGSNVIFWHKSSNRIYKGYLLSVLPGFKTAYI